MKNVVSDIEIKFANEIQQRNNRQVARWLIAGVVMIVIQVLIGGITRLTESGLSITEWKPITGALPPLNENDWLSEFNKYKTTDQFKYVHQNFSIHDFKFIFFWEWFHRLWARTMGMVFLVGFIYFLAKKKFNRSMILPMAVLFILGALQGVIGWLMVKSGLVPEKYFVGHVELTTHFIAALILLAYTLWFACTLFTGMQEKIVSTKIKSLQWLLACVLFVQLIYGGFMAGLKAAMSAPTWPDINGKFLPASATELQPFSLNFINNPLMIHFIHRSVAYLFFILTVVYFIQTKTFTSVKLFARFRMLLLICVCVQVVLGIGSLLNATNADFIPVAALHQFVAMLIVIMLVLNFYPVKKQRVI